MEVKEKVINILCDKLGVDEYEVTEEKSLTNDLGADSLDTVEIIMEIEKVFDIKIDDKEISDIKTIGDIIRKVENMQLER